MFLSIYGWLNLVVVIFDGTGQYNYV
jgi:hypothetical protein